MLLQHHYDDEPQRDKIVFHNTTSELQDQDQDQNEKTAKQKTKNDSGATRFSFFVFLKSCYRN